jgi:hypothetical protein
MLEFIFTYKLLGWSKNVLCAFIDFRGNTDKRRKNMKILL